MGKHCSGTFEGGDEVLHFGVIQEKLQKGQAIDNKSGQEGPELGVMSTALACLCHVCKGACGRARQTVPHTYTQVSCPAALLPSQSLQDCCVSPAIVENLALGLVPAGQAT